MKLNSKIIDRAKQGGYEVGVNTDAEILLDHLFFQALGKAMGWEYQTGKKETDWWLHNWHSFIDHLASGGSVDEFFNNLIK